jgi:hypothetical protein
MIITFTDLLQGIDWIAEKVENETQFEILREDLLFNYIYTGVYFLDSEQSMTEFMTKMPLWRLAIN